MVFDLVLLDLVMDDMDGLAVLQAMGADADMCKIPIIIMSGKDDQKIIA
jgi:PleD family two-component response regulator